MIPETINDNLHAQKTRAVRTIIAGTDMPRPVQLKQFKYLAITRQETKPGERTHYEITTVSMGPTKDVTKSVPQEGGKKKASKP